MRKQARPGKGKVQVELLVLLVGCIVDDLYKEVFHSLARRLALNSTGAKICLFFLTYANRSERGNKKQDFEGSPSFFGGARRTNANTAFRYNLECILIQDSLEAALCARVLLAG